MVASGGLMATAGAMGERRGMDEYVEDNWVSWKIRSAYIQSEEVKAGNINVSTYMGKVLLTGTAVSQEEIDAAVAIARKTRGVREVASELKVQFVTASEMAQDVLLSNHIKFLFLADQAVRGLDIHVETTKGVVFLTGLAKNVTERDRALDLARGVQGVKEVVSYIEISGQTLPLARDIPNGSSH